ncbi:MAG: L-2-amino-thiazoline-4-carboxylic acid hydrolase [Erysipelotrichaceae bacterium]|nr:L-2-amino-thiazoline-4-carboxylic acid hydrolase [Erysipelotrichaceae bacterium]
MKYGMMGAFIKIAFSKTVFDYIEKEIPEIDMASYKKRVSEKYRQIVERTPGIGSMKDNMFVMTMYAGAFLIALYKEADGKLDEEKLKGLIKAASYCPLMVKAKKGKSAFTQREIANRTRQSKWSRDHIKEYPMNWFYYFETVPGKEEYYITHKQCGICKLTKQEDCEHITKYLCMMDYYTFEMQGAVLDRTKTLGYGDDECNFHLMSRERADEIGFVKSPDAK